MSTPEERGNGGARITVSEDKLDAKLARLELSLVDRITSALEAKADEAYVTQLHARIHTAEGSVSALTLLLEAARDKDTDFEKKDADFEKRLRLLERFRYAIPSAAVIAAVGACIAAMSGHHFHF